MNVLFNFNEGAHSHAEAGKDVLLIVADDLTGALDSSVPFANPEHSQVFAVDTSYTTDPNFPKPHDITARDTLGPNVVSTWTDSRALTPISAKLAAARATKRLCEADSLFIKIDSTLRGNPADHMAGALEAWRLRHPRAFAVICPAHPAMGRTVVNGQVLDQLVPITESPAANDPISPPFSSLLSEIFVQSDNLEIRDISRRLAQHHNAAGDTRAKNVYVDASSPDDLKEIAAAIISLGNVAVAVGSAGLAKAIAELRTPVSISHETRRSEPSEALSESVAPGRTLVLVTSLHPSARLQLAALMNSHLDVKTTAYNSSGVHANIVVVTTPDRRDPRIRFTQAAASNEAITAASRAAALLRSGSFSSIVVVGGDGASALLGEVGSRAIELTSQLLPGVPLGNIHGGQFHGMTIATRSGGFGNSAHLIEILSELGNRIKEKE
jgi:uncharacterized protein YgbK (DUF1537 family)